MKHKNPNQLDLFKKREPVSEKDVGDIILDNEDAPVAGDMADYDKMAAEESGGKPVEQRSREEREAEKQKIKKAIEQTKRKLGMLPQKDLPLE